MMRPKLSSMEERDRLVKDYLATRDQVRRRFRSEALGEISLQEDAAKLFKPIITETQKQITASTDQTTELRKVVNALAAVPRPQQSMALEEPATAREKEEQQIPSTILVNPYQDLDIDVIKQYKFEPPSKLNLSDSSIIDRVIKDVNAINTYKLG
jgi:hypothetical protein